MAAKLKYRWREDVDLTASSFLNKDTKGNCVSDKKTKLKIRGLTKTYGRVTALDNVDLDLLDGEFLTMLGPSGSGKSTLLWAVAGLNDPDSGDVWIDGTNATNSPASERGIGMVFQNYALFPHMTIAQNISFPLEMKKIPARERAKAVKDALEMVKLPDVGPRFPAQLSGGQQQRIALARAFVANPSIVLMDEPLGALDKKLRDHLQLEIKHLHEDLGTTVLYVTHDQEEAMVMSDRICLMNDGHIEQIGTPADLYFRPVTLFAADFLGESNMFEGRFVANKDGVATIDVKGVGQVKTISDQVFDEGENIIHMTRPESLILLENGETRDNQAKGIVNEVIVSGTVTKLYVEVEQVGAFQITQLTKIDNNFAKGDQVTIGWDITAGVVLLNTGSAPHDQ